ncbi:MAG: PfkB family carbohydrate kinase [Candidatus Heimdallarchaeota archaeon]
MSENKPKQLSFLFIGHLAVDSIIRFKKLRKPSLGGSVSFGSLALRKYDQNGSIRIISNLGILNFNMALLDLLKNNNIDLRGIKSLKTNNTQFVLDYINHSRALTLKTKSPNLNFEDFPGEFIANKPNVIVLVPLCNEISYSYVSKILEAFPDVFIGLDVQGFIRHIDNGGKVSYVWNSDLMKNMKAIIDLVGDRLILKGSEIEMKLLSNNNDLDEVMYYFNKFDNNGIYIMTLGEAGSRVIKKGQEIMNIPAFKAKKVVDETGAGDVYLAIFLHEFLSSNKSWEAVRNSAYLASAAASFLVEKKGPDGFQCKSKVIKRVNKGTILGDFKYT